MAQDEAHLDHVPHVLYRMYDDERRLLYIGISSTFGKRLDKHLRDKPWFGQIAYISVSHYSTRTGCMAAERRAIVTERPKHNLAHTGQPGDPFVAAPRTALRISDLPPRQPTARPAPAPVKTPWPEVAEPGRPRMAGPGLRPVPDLEVGYLVSHDTLGVGRVIALRGEGNDTQAEVAFAPYVGAKWLLLRYAPIEVLAA